MIHLSFALPEPSSPWHRTWDNAQQVDPAAITETDLRYKYFGVNFEMTVGNTEIVSKKRFVTLVDLALSLAGVLQRIAAGDDAAFGFTESDEVIHLHREGDLIAVASSKRQARASASPEEIEAAVRDFLRAAHSRLITEIPGLASNPVIGRFNPG